MSKKWRSSRKVLVDGAAFTRARLAFKNKDEELFRGAYGAGSQEWLAERARVSPGTVFMLEKGQATLRTVDAISNVLQIKGREFIQGYGEDFTTFKATNVVDFRPFINGREKGNEEAYLEAAFLVTLDPIVIEVDDDFIDTAKLQRAELVLTVGNMSIDFTWLYNVRLTSLSSTWLGDEEDVSEVGILTRRPYQQSIMFKQNALDTISWVQFLDHIKITHDNQVLLTVRLIFKHFEKQGHVLISIEEVKGLLGMGFPKGFPYWIQPKALMVNV